MKYEFKQLQAILEEKLFEEVTKDYYSYDLPNSDCIEEEVNDKLDDIANYLIKIINL